MIPPDPPVSRKEWIENGRTLIVAFWDRNLEGAYQAKPHFAPGIYILSREQGIVNPLHPGEPLPVWGFGSVEGDPSANLWKPWKAPNGRTYKGIRITSEQQAAAKEFLSTEHARLCAEYVPKPLVSYLPSEQGSDRGIFRIEDHPRFG